MSIFEWTCPHCDRVQTSGNPNFYRGYANLQIGEPAEGRLGLTYTALRCLNSACKKSSVTVWVTNTKDEYGNRVADFKHVHFVERIMPRGASVPQPEYIPAPIRADYAEACLIRTFSPKASATLSRRCLQGMIRDFAKITKPTLDAEIKALKAAVADGTAPRSVSDESVAAIDHVRRIGNIGAHMEKDINVIIDVDEGEAQALTDLIELLLREWYVDRHNRQQRLTAVAAIGVAKEQAKLEGGKSPSA